MSQEVYDAVSAQFDYVRVSAQDAVANVASEYTRPSVVFRPLLRIDGNQWCALYGDNLQDGIAGFGDSPDAAMRDFDRLWCESLTKKGGG